MVPSGLFTYSLARMSRRSCSAPVVDRKVGSLVRFGRCSTTLLGPADMSDIDVVSIIEGWLELPEVTLDVALVSSANSWARLAQSKIGNELADEVDWEHLCSAGALEAAGGLNAALLVRRLVTFGGSTSLA